MHTSKFLVVGLLAGGLSAFQSTARAIVMTPITPTSATASSFYAPDDRNPEHTRDGSGLTANATATTFDDPHGNNPGGTMWLTNNDSATPTITWTLGGTYDLDGFHLWNYNEVAGGQHYVDRGVAIANVLVSTTDTGENFTLVNAAQTFTEATGLTTYTGEDYSLGANGVRRVRFNVLSDFPDNPDNYIGLSEIRFFTPEPASISFVAFAILPLLKRRRSGR